MSLELEDEENEEIEPQPPQTLPTPQESLTLPEVVKRETLSIRKSTYGSGSGYEFKAWVRATAILDFLESFCAAYHPSQKDYQDLVKMGRNAAENLDLAHLTAVCTTLMMASYPPNNGEPYPHYLQRFQKAVNGYHRNHGGSPTDIFSEF